MPITQLLVNKIPKRGGGPPLGPIKKGTPHDYLWPLNLFSKIIRYIDICIMMFAKKRTSNIDILPNDGHFMTRTDFWAKMQETLKSQNIWQFFRFWPDLLYTVLSFSTLKIPFINHGSRNTVLLSSSNFLSRIWKG